MVAAEITDKALQQSVQEFSETTYEQSASLFMYFAALNEILPAWGTRERDRVLREFWRAVHGTLYQGAISGVVKKIAATPWEIKGPSYPKWKTAYFQSIVQNANFGTGWDPFISKFLTDYLTQDFGAVIEIIAPGDPSKPLDPVAITGIATLDSLSCGATDNPEYPLVYQSRKKGSAIHALHRQRALRFVDMPDPDEQALDTGLCALSRMISPANVQILMGRHQNEKLSDLPMPGIVTVAGMSPQQFQLALREYEADRQKDGQSIFRKIMRLTGADPQNPPKIDFTSFSQLPDNFDYEKYMNLHAMLIAAALNIDLQEFWALQARGLGTGTQSEILHTKSERKGFAHLYALIERAMNIAVLPKPFEFKFKFQDRESDKADAERAQVWVGIAMQLSAILTPQQQAQLLANNVEQFADVLLDEDGQVKLPDSDVRPEDTPVIGESNTTPGTADGADAVTADDAKVITKRKDFGGTAADFARDFTDLIVAGIDSDVNRRRFGTVARAHLRNYGTQAYRDAMEVGGVIDDLSTTDLSNITDWLSEQSGYVTNFADEVYSNGLSEAQIAVRADMWANKSLRDIYNRGLLAADADGMYRWKYDPAKEHCDDCKRLHNQVHRLSAWKKRGLEPGSSKLKCKGYFCGCGFERAPGVRERGSY